MGEGKENRAFVSYRIPGEDIIQTIFPEAGDILLFDDYQAVANQSGFVFHPFSVEEYLPGIFIKSSATQENVELPELEVKLDINYQSTAYEEYTRQFEHLMQTMEKGSVQKVILSKLKVVPQKANTDFREVFAALCDKYDNAFVYLLHLPPFGTWMGASPEVMLTKKQNRYQSVSLAGTKALSDEREWTLKEIEEQAIVSRYLEDILNRQEIKFEKTGPLGVNAGNVSHLKTSYEYGSPKDIAGELIKELHPTPAVCGMPKDEAKQLILETEQHHREYYTGFLGPQNMNDETNLFVNLRCMKLTQSKIVLFVGGGLTIDSELEAEWLETEHKAETLLSVLEKI